jgi:CDP-paratose 2-epimerase
MRNGAMLITGGAGFVGANLADSLLRAGVPVVVFDDLSRAGVEQNAAWLSARHGDLLKVVRGDVRNAPSLQAALDEALCLADGAPLAGVFHFAAQVAVTTSLVDPMHDFSVNVAGTLNLLELLRAMPMPPPLLHLSTNKVYGELAGLRTVKIGNRYVPDRPRIAEHGIDETQPLDFQSPYGCSKGAADQYVLEYARSYGLPASVFRMSCIYGPRQFGTEDQGWIAHFLIRALAGQPITVYGDGMQVRDALFVDDLVQALLTAHGRLSERSAGFAGEAFNIGGGPDCSLSLIELVDYIAELLGERPALRFAPWRVGDQRYYVSDTSKFAAASGWTPRIGVRQGIAALCDWLREMRTVGDNAGHVAAVGALTVTADSRRAAPTFVAAPETSWVTVAGKGNS